MIDDIVWDKVFGEDLHDHVGRLAALRRGVLYQILAVGPVVDGERAVTVPEAPGAPGHVEIVVFDDEEFPVRDAPSSQAARTYLIRRGHCLAPLPDPGCTGSG